MFRKFDCCIEIISKRCLILNRMLTIIVTVYVLMKK
jgi:hypothetical protein